MQIYQPITAVGVSFKSHSRHAPLNKVFKSEAKIRVENDNLYVNYDVCNALHEPLTMGIFKPLVT